MKKNEEFYLQLKKNLEAENEELVLENNNLNVLKSSLSEEAEELKEQLSYRDYEYDSLKAKLMESQEELAALISLEKEAQFEHTLVDVDPSELYVPLIPQDFLEEISKEQKILDIGLKQSKANKKERTEKTLSELLKEGFEEEQKQRELEDE